MGEAWTINSETSKRAFLVDFEAKYQEHKYLTYDAPRIGADRSLGQNALFHVFCTEWIAFKLKKHVSAVSAAELQGMKRTAKKMFYVAHPAEKWIVHRITDYTTGETKLDYTSSKSWKHGEMYMALEFMQLIAADQGLILESRGVFLKLQREASLR